jgi:hypothetical protein
MAMQTVSVGDIAEKVKRPGEALQTAIDRVKNWAKEGLIKPEGGKNPGVGRRRQFSHGTLIDAVMIQILTDGTGMRAVDAVEIIRDPKWASTIRKPSDGNFFVVSRSITKDDWSIGSTKKSALSQVITQSPRDIHIVLDLNNLFKQFGVEL